MLALQKSLPTCYATDMNAHVKKLTEEAAKLSPLERAELIEGILSSLDKPDTDIDRAWAHEAQDRLEAYERGEIEALDFEEVVESAIKGQRSK